MAGLIAVDAACIPLPSVIMSFAGYLASTGRFSLVLVAMAGAVGCNIGSTLAYAVDARGGRPLVERWGHYLLLNQGDLDRADRFFQRFGGPGVMVARLLPVVRTFIALPAGVAGMPMLNHVSRVVALVLRPSLCRLQAGRALGEAIPGGVRRCIGSTSSSSACLCSAWPGSCGGTSIIPGMGNGATGLIIIVIPGSRRLSVERHVAGHDRGMAQGMC